MKTHSFKHRFFSVLMAFWYRKHPLRWCLYPVSGLYLLVITLRRLYLERFCQQQVDVPVIVVGNITLGGAGKTPLVIALVDYFQARGLRVGVVTRGYGNRLRSYPHVVALHDPAERVGDEALLIAKKTQAMVVIAPLRMQAVHYLRQHDASDIIISDDGLQHYAMGRAVEIAVIDGVRGLGNGLCLPAGPLREQSSRLTQVDFMVANSGVWPGAYRMQIVPRQIVSLTQGIEVSAQQLPAPVAAVAGIGHPQRFFTTLDHLQLAYTAYGFPDHHRFSLDDFVFSEQAVIMTEKDAVKCQSFATDTMYALVVEATLEDSFWQALLRHPQLKSLGLTC